MAAGRPGPLNRIADMDRNILWREFQSALTHLNRNGIGFDIQQRDNRCATDNKCEFKVIFHGFGRADDGWSAG